MLLFPPKGYTFLIATALSLVGITSMAAPVDPSDTIRRPHSPVSIEIFTSPADDSVSCTIPFSRAGNLILIRARADSTVGSFVLDTGSPHLVLNLTYFRDYPTTIATDMEQGGVTSTGNTEVLQTAVKNLTFGSMQYDNTEAHLVNLGHIETSKGVKILGLLGMKLFRQCEMIIDYDLNLIYLHRISKKESSTYNHQMLKDTAAYRTVPIEMINDRALAKTEIAGKKLRLLIDFAAESNVLDSRLSNKVFENFTITRRVVLNGVGNRRVEALLGDLSNLKIGDELITTLPVLVTNLEKTCLTYESCIDGILGFDFLSLHKIGFNFVTRKMYIWR